MKEKVIGFLITFVVLTFLAWTMHGINIPLPSSYIQVLLSANTVFAFLSIFMQRLVIILYEMNVLEKRTGFFNYAIKYFAVFILGLNYHVQVVINRLPFILNKIMAVIFFIFMVTTVFGVLDLF